MDNFNLQIETNLLLAKQEVAGYRNNSEIINWALRLMDKGYASDNLYILAGMEMDDSWEIDTYFQRTLDDLGIVSNMPRKVLLDFYSINQIEKIIYAETSSLQDKPNMKQIENILVDIRAELYG